MTEESRKDAPRKLHKSPLHLSPKETLWILIATWLMFMGLAALIESSFWKQPHRQPDITREAGNGS